MTKIELLRKHIQLHEYANQWIDSVPHQIRTGFFDNPYCNALSNSVEMMLAEIFSPGLVEVIWWYLYDRGEDKIIEDDGKLYVINTVDDFINYVEQCYGELKESNNAAARTFRGR